ncbi:sensor histidine kinase [Kordiimonas laminariae]|uniref:sensor histidine kinase n=1 Tax=Kordiimonas laminariae TaxID=2917717 RepID=UPI001FF65963|nr:ATP-binding protein [Kordiimonas laminariae]
MGREKDREARQRLLVILVAVLGVIITVFATRQAWLNVEQEADSAFASKADLFIDRLHREITSSLSAAQDLYDFYNMSKSVPEERFRLLVSTNSTLKQHRYFVAIAYQLEMTEKDGFLRGMASFYGNDFQLKGPVLERDTTRFPLIYPWSPDAELQTQLLGMNIGGHEQIAAFLRATGKEDKPSAILLPDFPEIDQGAEISVLLVNPYVTKAGALSYIVQLVDLPGLVREIADDVDKEGELIIQLNSSWFDAEDDNTASIAAGSSAILDNSREAADDRRVSTELTFGAGVWTVQAYAVEGSFRPSYLGVIVTFLLSAVISILLVYAIWIQSERSKRVVEIVNRRTRALKAAHEELEEHYKLLQNLNKDVEEARRAAETANRAKSEFLATMSHELRTPLNAILGFSQLLGEQAIGPIGDERYIEYAKDIHQSGSHLLSLINDILDLAKLESGKVQIERQQLSVRELVERVLTIQGQQAEEKGIAFGAEVDANMPDKVMGDELRLRQILINLSTNGIKFTHEGSVGIRIIEKSFKSGLAGWVLEVEDTGIGIPEEKQATLFDRFTQVDTALSRRHGGVGLGLAICRELVDRMGGIISVQSMPGVGTTVRVHLPLEEPAEDTVDDDSII